MERPGRKRGEEAVPSERRLLQGFVISEHRPDHFDSAGFGDRAGDARTELRQRLRLLPRPVVENEFVRCPDEILGHARAHASKSDEADFHRRVSFRAA